MMSKDNDLLIDQYKLYVEGAEKVSDRRQASNSFFLTLNSVLLAFAGFLSSLPFAFWHVVIAIAGVCICILWLLSIKSFRNLNTAKFKVIHSLEEQLPFKLFTDEWQLLDEGRSARKYLKLSVVEQGVPIVFMILFAIVTYLMT